ncbi:MAG TPA: NAD(P)H-binding protein [Polyangiaceae bacterium]|jgi:putative NADH-flavin reductase|nr:NAD(P)H-binding protein [Polyangiaceae bacterium]
MKIALIGGTGFVGSKLLAEALSRGHQVTVLVRDPLKVALDENVIALPVDVHDTPALVVAIEGHAAVLSAYNPALPRGLEGARSIIAAVKLANVPRLFCVGGAGSLLRPDGTRVLDAHDFPTHFRQGALNTAEFLLMLREEPTLDWTMLSPAEILSPGTRIGHFRLGDDHVLVDESGQSRISVEDYAVAFLDELDSPRHSRARFSVAY